MHTALVHGVVELPTPHFRNCILTATCQLRTYVAQHALLLRAIHILYMVQRQLSDLPPAVQGNMHYLPELFNSQNIFPSYSLHHNSPPFRQSSGRHIVLQSLFFS